MWEYHIQYPSKHRRPRFLKKLDKDKFEINKELIEEIYQTIYYYNNKRFHSSLKISPVLFKQKYINSLQKVLE